MVLWMEYQHVYIVVMVQIRFTEVNFRTLTDSTDPLRY